MPGYESASVSLQHAHPLRVDPCPDSHLVSHSLYLILHRCESWFSPMHLTLYFVLNPGITYGTHKVT